MTTRGLANRFLVGKSALALNQSALPVIRIDKIKKRNEPSAGEIELTKEDAVNLANHWIAAWNTHDLELIMTHYDNAVELTSPVAAQLLGTPGGNVRGKAALRDYFQRGLKAYSELHFQLVDVLCGVNSVVLYYTNQKGTRTAEFMELSPEGKVVRVMAHYNA